MSYILRNADFVQTPAKNLVLDQHSAGPDHAVAGQLIFNTTLNEAQVFKNGSWQSIGGSPVPEGETIWHSGNDGTGSGLDADTVDGYHVDNLIQKIHYVNGVYIHGNWGAMYSGTTSNIGAIILDFGTDNIMFDAEVSIRAYNYSAQIQLSGYTYVANTNWHHQKASGNPSAPLNVRFRTSGVNGKRYVMIGETNTDWGSHLQVSVTKFHRSLGTVTQSQLPISLSTSYMGTVTSSTHEIGTIWHSGNLAKSEFAEASHSHAYVPTSRTVNSKALSANISLTAADVGAAASSHTHDYAPASHTHSYLPLAGGTMTGPLYPQQNTSYTTGQARRIIMSTAAPSGGGNGDVWLLYV